MCIFVTIRKHLWLSWPDFEGKKLVNFFVVKYIILFNFASAGSGLLCSICIRRKEKVHKSGLIEQAGPAQDGMDRKKENIIILLKFSLIL